MKPETKLWHELKRITPKISWTRIENSSLFGTPDLLGYNAFGHFFTVELKVTSGNKIRFSPHQIAFPREASTEHIYTCQEAQSGLLQIVFRYQYLGTEKEDLNIKIHLLVA